MPGGYSLALAPPAVEAGLLPWHLQAPVSRESVLALGQPGTLLVAGGLTSGGSSADGVFALDLSSGRLTLAGQLKIGTHDAASAVVGTTGLVIGGGDLSPSANVQSLGATGSVRPSGQLPQPRADAAAVAIGGAAYIVGGYSGSSLDPEVLSTGDGATFTPVAALPVPVRYPAVAAWGAMIYVFGGETLDGQPVSAVQRVDPATGQAEVIGHLPLPLAGAAAGFLGGVAYIAGGTTQTSRSGGSQAVGDVFAFDPSRMVFLRGGSLPVAVSNAGAAVRGGRLYLIGGETSAGVPTADAQFVAPDRAFGAAGSPGAGSPYYGDELLVADRGNNRLVLLDDSAQVIWSYPAKGLPAPAGGFYFPDDAFFIRHGTAIISNQEENETIVELAYPSGRLLFSYGHPGVAGSAPGYLDNPDDAYLLRNGEVTAADPMNCRVLVIDPSTESVLHQIGTDGVCVHDPPYDVASPNGDTPLADGNLLISEINGSWVDEYTPDGRLVWDVQLPIGYPSDPQQVGHDLYLVADYEQPGAIVEFNRAGEVLYRYQAPSGPGELDHPSLVEMLPSGVFLLNDDYNDRLVAIDPATGALVWQYGETGVPGSAPGFLNTPDGFDILAPGGSTPTHPSTG